MRVYYYRTCAVATDIYDKYDNRAVAGHAVTDELGRVTSNIYFNLTGGKCRGEEEWTRGGL